ncbi:MAG TPA: ABC transporter permease, partial [Thermoprotei archaeon]|nr:ABC transporter permease [Thermoprotei archaeon]
MGTEEYEKKLLDRVSDAIIDGIANIIEKVRPGYKKKNKAKIDERKLMFYALNRSPAGVVGLFLVILFIFFGIFGPYVARYPYNY